jgi:hypothetical protein
LCLFLAIAVLLHVKRHTSGRTTAKGEDQWSTRIERGGAARAAQEPISQTMVVQKASNEYCLQGFFLDARDVEVREVEIREAAKQVEVVITPLWSGEPMTPANSLVLTAAGSPHQLRG